FLLIPEEGILSLVPEAELRKNKMKLSTIVKIEQYFQCSRSALLFRLSSIGLIDLEEYRGYESNVIDSAKYFGFDGSLYLKGNNGLTVGEYGGLARNLFLDGKISESHYAELMTDIGIDIDTE
ncbi:MAG: transcriptional regulator, partial [Bacteroidota bacterium]